MYQSKSHRIGPIRRSRAAWVQAELTDVPFNVCKRDKKWLWRSVGGGTTTTVVVGMHGGVRGRGSNIKRIAGVALSAARNEAELQIKREKKDLAAK